MLESDFIWSTEADAILNHLELKEALNLEPLILPGIQHFMKKRGVEYQTLLKQDRVTATCHFDEYIKWCQASENDMYEHATISESCLADPKIVAQIDRFKTATCDHCGFRNIKKRKLIMNPSWDEWSLKFVEDEIKKIKGPEVRKMMPVRRQFSWTYICEKCLEKKGNK